MRAPTSIVAVLGLMAAVPLALCAQPQLEVRTLSVAEGLSQSSGQVLLQDRLGIVWIGTQNGLNRYDGNENRIFRSDPSNPESLSGTSVIDLIEGADGSIWVATETGGLSRYDRERQSFDTYRHDPEVPGSLSANELTAVEIDATGELWVGTAGAGLNKLDAASGTFVNLASSGDDPNALPSDWIIDIKAESDGSLLIATDGGGLSRLHPETGRFDTLWPSPSDSLRIPVAIEMTVDRAGGIWVATPEGLVHLDRASETETRVAGLEDWLVLSVHAARDGLIWAGTADGGLFVVDGGSAIRVDEVLNLGDDTFFSLLEDRSGLIWAGTESAGVKLLTPVEDHFEVLGQDMEDSDTWSILARSNGEVWVGTSAGGVDVLDARGSVVRTYRTPDTEELPDGAIPWGLVVAMEEDHRGRIWLAMDIDGVARWDPDTDRFSWFEPNVTAGFRPDAIMDFHESEDGAMWLATAGWGLVRYDPDDGSFSEHTIAADSLDAANAVTHIAATPDGWWLATLGGIARFDPSTRTAQLIRANSGRDDGLPTASISHITPATDGGLWVATQLGLLRMAAAPAGAPWNPEAFRFERLSSESGLPDDVVYAVLPDPDGTLWMSTNRGLGALNPETGDVRVFGVRDGLPGFEFNHGAHDSGPDGRLYFGGIEGMTRVLATEASFREFQAPVVITAVDIFNEEVVTDLSPDAELRVAHDQNYLTFTFASADYLRPEANRFAYRLEPGETGWTQAGTRRYQSYNDLAPGTYTFRVRGTNSDGTWNPIPASLTVEIIPPFWGRAWFRLLLAFAVFGSVLAAFRHWHRRGIRERDTRIMIQRRINERLESERVHLARELHDGPIQQLQLSGFQLQALHEEVGPESAALRGVREAVSDAMGELRSICGELRPPALVHFGLSSAIRSHAERQLQSFDDLSIELQLPTEQTLLSPTLRLALFRMYQEAMSNMVRHARPCSAVIRLTISPSETTLEVQDSGPGFVLPNDWSAMAAKRHFGLLGASERAAAVGGTMSVDSRPGQGTTITFRAPTEFEDPQAS